MGQLDEFADGIDGVIADLEAQASVLNERKNALSKRGGEVMGRWHDHLKSKDAALTKAENAINKVSNALPTDGPSISEKAP